MGTKPATEVQFGERQQWVGSTYSRLPEPDHGGIYLLLRSANGSRPSDTRRPIEQSTCSANDRLALVTGQWMRVSERQQPLHSGLWAISRQVIHRMPLTGAVVLLHLIPLCSVGDFFEVALRTSLAEKNQN